MSSQLIYLNGEYLPLAEARVSVLDRGFIFGDGVYEVIPAYAGKILRFEHHMQRLSSNLAAVRITNPFPDSQWLAILQKLITETGSEDQQLYLQITRGVAPRDHSFPHELQPTVFVMSKILLPVQAELLKNGISAITLDDTRWQYCNIKTIALQPNVLLRQQAIDKNAMEAILIRDGEVTEGAASNIFIVKQGLIKTPPKGEHLLPGITRDLIIELAQTNNMPLEETSISEEEFLIADEIWLTSSTKEILPITRLNDNHVGDGKPGAIWRDMYQKFQNYKATLRKA